ncbi:MAG: hypothetical protein AAF456_00590 [Planctomycetota bacterium]
MNEPETGITDPELLLDRILADPGLTQHVVRSGSADQESQVGYYRCTFEPGRQRHALHVPLTPPFQEVPGVQAMVMDNERATIKVTDCRKFGIRAEIVMERAVEVETRVLVEIIAYPEVNEG